MGHFYLIGVIAIDRFLIGCPISEGLEPEIIDIANISTGIYNA